MLLLVVLSAVLVVNGVFSDTNYRLNTPLRPSSYAIAITPYFDTGDDRAFTFDAEVVINFNTEATTNQIKLHTENLTFTAENITVWSISGAISLNATNPLEFDDKYTFAYINLQSNLEVVTEYSLKIIYRGPIRTDLNGFYRNYYIENNVKKWLGATQMEPTHARKVFPCFDEPELKAMFTLTIDRPQNYKPSLTNTKLQATIPLSNGYVREIFYPTPRMSTYLVAFLVSEFEAAGYVTNGTKEFGVFTRPEAKNQSEYAFDFGYRVVGALGDYFGIDYYSTNTNLKLDHIALPDFRAGAMENWGLIKYREALFLYVPEESTPYYKYRVAQIVAHETTHMWFGNLVTCHWWSNTWLNEGFANYFQDYITALIEPEVGSEDILVTGSVYSAYDADDSPTSPPISNDNVNSPDEISAHFGTVTYQKAGSVIRMMHHLIGDDSFRIGLNLYLQYNQFGSGYPEKLYSALNESVYQTNALGYYPRADFTDIMSSWISQAGHPILQVDIDYEESVVTLSQRRFYIDSADSSNEVYKIPITYTTENSPDFLDTKPEFIMDTKDHILNIKAVINATKSWVIFNIQETGLYRVNYDNHSWEIISAALKSNKREQIHHLNRAKIVNDLFAFLYANLVHFDRLYDILEFLTDETDYSVWYAAIRGINKLRSSFFGTPVLNDIDDYTTRLLQSILSKMGYSEQPNEDVPALRNRMQVLELACKVGHTGCMGSMVALFRNFKDNGVEVSPSLRPVVYCQGLRFGDGEDYEFLWRRMTTTNVANEATVIGAALGCTTQTDKLKKYLVSMLEENSPIKTQDLTVPLTSILANYSNVNFILHELQDNYQLWTSIYSSMDTILATIASVLHTEEDIVEFETWLSSCSQCLAHDVSSAQAAMEAAKARTLWAQAHEDDVLSILRSSGFLSSPSFIVLAFGLLTTVFSKY